jgi:hypothetical protein
MRHNVEATIMFRVLVLFFFGFLNFACLSGCSSTSIATESGMDQDRNLTIEEIFEDSEDLFPLVEEATSDPNSPQNSGETTAGMPKPSTDKYDPNARK